MRFGCRAIDLVGKENLREDRPGPKLEGTFGLIEHIPAKHIGGHQIGSALQTSKGNADRRGERPRQSCLADTGYVLEQKVPSRQERNHRQLDDFFFAANHPPDALDETLRRLGRVFGNMRDAVLSHVWSVTRQPL